MKQLLHNHKRCRSDRVRPGPHQRGAMLIEIMVAGMLLVVGIGGLGAAQIAGLRTAAYADSTTRLINLHASIIDRLRLHRDAAGRGEFNIDLPRTVTLETITAEFPLLDDLVTRLHFDNVQGYLRVQCDRSTSFNCAVCVGTYSSPDDADRLQQNVPPVNVLCSRQQTQ